ncbi:hypothetical protein M422DRAFT_272726 [Sphaerobolus stellatus SS14]|uniref:WD40 repeat-like protein n=1 Tax=Sphaerobolus stellatus (strain SS14) TaxID=990650 RepID=A0A0C9UL89_SPHS4|nr:hypothetical protein M422DRAFT_272726 [Sphaerobolus stellatus SS14]
MRISLLGALLLDLRCGTHSHNHDHDVDSPRRDLGIIRSARDSVQETKNGTVEFESKGISWCRGEAGIKNALASSERTKSTNLILQSHKSIPLNVHPPYTLLNSLFPAPRQNLHPLHLHPQRLHALFHSPPILHRPKQHFTFPFRATVPLPPTSIRSTARRDARPDGRTGGSEHRREGRVAIADCVAAFLLGEDLVEAFWGRSRGGAFVGGSRGARMARGGGAGAGPAAALSAAPDQDRARAKELKNRIANLLERHATEISARLFVWFIMHGKKGPHLSDAVKEIQKQQQSVQDLDLLSQFKKLIKSPLEAYYRQISQFDGSKPQIILLIIDALDEANRQDTRQWNELLETLAEWRQLPGIFRLIITSRPNDDIRGYLTSKCVEETLATGSSVSEESQADIDKYLRHRFLSIRKKIQQISPSWSDKDIIPQLVNNVAGLFMWAKVALDYIEVGGNPLKRLQDIQYSTSIGHTQPLDDLYMRILQGIYRNLDKDEQDLLQKVLWTIIMAKQPIDRLSIEELINVPIHSLLWVEQELRPVLAEQNNGHLLQSCHKPFTDFMLEQERSGEFAVKEEISVSIPQSLQHACKYWSEYYPARNLTVKSKNSIQNLEIFLQKHFFHWLEVLSIISAGHYATSLLETANRWLGTSLLANHYRKLYNPSLQVIGGSIQAWPNECQVFLGHQHWVFSVTFSPDGTKILSASGDKTVQIGDISTGRTLGQPLCHQRRVMSGAFSPDGTNIASTSGNKIQKWDISTGQALRQPFKGHQDRVIVWDAFTSQSLGSLEGHQDTVNSIAISPDGTKIVSGSDDRTVQIWDAFTSQSLGSLEGHQGRVNSIAISPDGTKIVSGSNDRTVRIWDLSTGNLEYILEGHQLPVQSVAFSPDGTKIISGSTDRSIQVWEITTGHNLGQSFMGHQGPIFSVTFSPDGTKIASGSTDRTVRVWDASTGDYPNKPLEYNQAIAMSVTFSPDGMKIVSSLGSSIQVWDAYTGQKLGQPLDGHQSLVTSVALSPDGKKIVSGSLDKTVKVWEESDGWSLKLSLKGHKRKVRSVAFSPDGTKNVSGSDDKTVRIWNASTGQSLKQPLEGHQNAVTSVAFSNDGTKIVSGSYDSIVRVWDAFTGQSLGSLEGHGGGVNSIAISPDGTKIASGSDDRTVIIWDISTGQVLGQPFHHQNYVTSVAFSPDGTNIVSGSSLGVVYIWEISTGQSLGDPLEGHQGTMTSTVFSPDGTKIVSSSYDGTIRVWKLTGKNIEQSLEGHQVPITTWTWNAKSGWILDAFSKAPIAWVPNNLWPGFRTPSIQLVIGASETVLDFSNYIPWEEWKV